MLKSFAIATVDADLKRGRVGCNGVEVVLTALIVAIAGAVLEGKGDDNNNDEDNEPD